VTRKKPLPDIQICPCGRIAYTYHTPDKRFWMVRCPCGWAGPHKRSEFLAITFWNRTMAAPAELRLLRRAREHRVADIIRDVCSIQDTIGTVFDLLQKIKRGD
jgi:hypothetical protein